MQNVLLQKKNLLVIVSVLVLIFLIVLSLTRKENPSAAMLAECNDKSNEQLVNCLEPKILTFIDKNPSRTNELLEGLYDLAKQGKVQADPRSFSSIIHDAGMMFAEKNTPLKQAYDECGSTFKEGCRHGVVMEYLDDDKYNSETPVNEFFKICDEFKDNSEYYLNCLHGVGHEMEEKIKYKDLNEILSRCPNDSDKKESACVSGMLMEYSTGEHKDGKHSHDKVYTREIPCEQLNDEFKQICYTSVGSYRQYESNHESFETTYKFCKSIPETYYSGCMMGLSERILLYAAENSAKASSVCKNFSGKQNQDECFKYLFAINNSEFKNPQLGIELQLDIWLNR